MAKSVSLTIRIDEDLKKDAEIACAHIEHTLSSFIRASLKDCVSSYHRVKVRDGGYYKAFMETEEAQKSYEFLKREVAKHPNGLVIPVEDDSNQTSSTQTSPEKMRAIKAIIKPSEDIKVDETGRLDPTTMPRKMRRAYERELARGTLNAQPMDKYQTNPSIGAFDPEQRLRELFAKEKKGHLTRQERNQKNALLRAGVELES